MEKRTRPGRKAVILCLIIVPALLLCMVGGYLACYFSARHQALEGEYAKADRLLLLPSVTALHDGLLYDYIQAGLMLADEEYSDAAKAFYALSEEDYYDSHDLMLECIYREGMQLMEEEGEYEQAYLLLNENARSGHDESKSARKEALYRWALQLRDEGDNIAAYEKIVQVGSYNKAEALEEELRTQLYVEGIELYRQKEYGLAMQRFELFPDYEESGNYLLLIYARAGLLSSKSNMQRLAELFYFEDTPQVLLYDNSIAFSFLSGTWVTADGNYGFEFGDDGVTLYNLPLGKNGYICIKDGRWYDVPEYGNYQEVLTDQYEVMYTLTLTSPNTLEVYCHANGRSYTLYRR